MRVAVWRRVAVGLLAVPLFGVAAVAQFPVPSDPGRLKADTAALAAERRAAAESPLAAERSQLMNKLNGILDRLNALPPVAPWPSPRPPVGPPKTTPGNGGRPVDSLGLAMNLFRENDTEAALAAFRQIDPAALLPADRAFVRYMIASGLRRLGRTTEAQAAYREVAEARADNEFVAGMAVWQLDLIRSNQELQAQLEQLRARAKGR